MNRILIALVLLGLGLYFASQTRDGYRDGKMPLMISSRISPFTFDRFQVPSWFWAATAINIVVTAAMALAGILILAVGAHQ
ncbi:MAG: hypothetical protein ABIR08_02235 [Sphingomonas sp.]